MCHVAAGLSLKEGETERQTDICLCLCLSLGKHQCVANVLLMCC
jgi:hypothetical protein